MNEIPRRAQMQQWVPAERAIYDACLAVEAMSADVRLTEAVTLLGQARDKVADYVDGVAAVPLPPDNEEPPLPTSDVLPWLKQAILDYRAHTYRPSAHYLLAFRGAVTEIERLRAAVPLPPDSDLRSALEALGRKLAQEAHEIDQDGDFCCAQTRREDAGMITDLLRAVPLPREQAQAIADMEFARSTHLAWAEHLEAHADSGEVCSQCADKPYKLDAAHEREWVQKYDVVIALLRRALPREEEKPPMEHSQYLTPAQAVAILIRSELERPENYVRPESGVLRFCITPAHLGILLQAIESAALPREEPQPWQPIETAPKDGKTWMLVTGCNTSPLVLVAGYDPHTGRWNAYGHTHIAEPTHWMPLPDPPPVSQPRAHEEEA